MRTASNGECGRRFRRLRIALFVSLSCGLAVTTEAAGKKIYHPDDGFPTIQAAADAAGCGGTVFLAAGTYNERVVLPCTARLIGAGIGHTIFDGTNLAGLNDIPVVGVGNDPFALFPFQDDFEVAHLTVLAGPNTTAQGIASGWTRRTSIHDVEVIGFRYGITVDASTEKSIYHATVRGQGATAALPGACIQFRELDRFRSQLPGGHMTGHSAHHNTLEDCIFGLDLFNTVDALVYNNTIVRTQVGVRLVGVARFELYQNTISQSGLRGINLANAHDGLIRDNMLCANPTAIRYGQGAADRYGFGPSDNNTIRQNTFPSTGAGIVDEDPAPGSGNTEVKNVFGGCS